MANWDFIAEALGTRQQFRPYLHNLAGDDTKIAKSWCEKIMPTINKQTNVAVPRLAV